MKGRFYDDGINPLERDKHEYVVPENGFSRAMKQESMWSDDDDLEEVPF